MNRLSARVRAAALRARAHTARPAVNRVKRWAEGDRAALRIRATQAAVLGRHTLSAAWHRDPARITRGVTAVAARGHADNDPGTCCARCGRDMTDRRICTGCGATETAHAVWVCARCSWEGPSGWMMTGLGSLRCPHCDTKGTLYPAALREDGTLIPVNHHMW